MVLASEHELRTTIASSYDGLKHPDERMIFDALGAFAVSGASLSAIARVTDLSVNRCERTFSVLKSSSLVQQDERDPCHYKLHALAYEFARERLQQRERSMVKQGGKFEDLITGRMIRFYVTYTLTHREDFPALKADRCNVIHAALLAREHKAWEAVHDLWEGSDGWLDMTGDWSSWYSLLEGAVEANCMLENRDLQMAKTLDARSNYFDLTGQISKSLTDAKRSLELGYKTGDRKIITTGLVRLGSLYAEHLGAAEQAHASFEQAWKLCQDIPTWDESPYVAYQLALSYWSRGEKAKATDLLEKSLSISKDLPRSHKSSRYESFCVTSLGNLLAECGKYQQAREHLERSLELKLGDQYSTVVSIKSLARLKLLLGSFDEAVELLSRALRICKSIGAKPESLRTLRELGDAYCQRGDYNEGVAFYEEGMKVGSTTELPGELATLLSKLASAYSELDRYDEALAALCNGLDTFIQLAEQSENASRDVGTKMTESVSRKNAYLKGTILYKMGNTYVALQRYSEAIDCLERASDVLKDAASVAERLTVLEEFEKACKLAGLDEKAADVRSNMDAILTQAASSNDGNILRDAADYYIATKRLGRARAVLAQASALLEQQQAGKRNEKEIQDLGRSLRRLGRAFEEEEMYPEALSSYEHAARLLESRVGAQSYGVLMNDIGDVYRALGNLEQAMIHYEKAREYPDDMRGLMVTLRALADVYSELNQHEKALAIYAEVEKKLDSLEA